MTEFHPISISDKEWTEKFFKEENSQSADYCFGTLFMWDKRYRKQLASAGGRLIIKINNDNCDYFVFPVGSGDLRPAIDLMTRTASENSCPLVILGVTQEQMELLEASYPGRFEFAENRDYFDYIYSAEKISTFAGKKLHSKRNFCNRFEKTKNWDFVPLTASLIPDCMKILDEWTTQFETTPEEVLDEHEAIILGFQNWDALGLVGGVLREDGRALGFAVGERISNDTFDVHFEKALNSVPGAYPMVCREFARQILRDHPGVVYINREEDMGLDNLRKAKLDCYPEYLLIKYSAKEKL